MINCVLRPTNSVKNGVVKWLLMHLQVTANAFWFGQSSLVFPSKIYVQSHHFFTTVMYSHNLVSPSLVCTRNSCLLLNDFIVYRNSTNESKRFLCEPTCIQKNWKYEGKYSALGVHSNIKAFHTHIYTQPTLINKSLVLTEKALIPCIAGRQQHCQNVLAQSCTEYYRQNLTTPLIDHLLSGLSSHFDAQSFSNITEFLHLLPSSTASAKSSLSQQAYQTLLHFYDIDLPCTLFESQLDLWQYRWRADTQLVSLLKHPRESLGLRQQGFLLKFLWVLWKFFPWSAVSVSNWLVYWGWYTVPLKKHNGTVMTEEFDNVLLPSRYPSDHRRGSWWISSLSPSPSMNASLISTLLNYVFFIMLLLWSLLWLCCIVLTVAIQILSDLL